MPYEIRKTGPKSTPWCVYNTETGKNKGCSRSRELAISHMRALYGAEHGWKPTGKKRVSQRS